MKNFNPCGNQVLVRFVPTKPKEKKKGEIILLNNDKTTNVNGKQMSVDKMLFQVIKAGKDAKLDEFKIGDLVIFNDYDVKYLQDDNDNYYLLTKDSSIMATYESDYEVEDGWDLKKF